MKFHLLHSTSPHTFWLDHRLLPEVSAMLCAMSSRAPVGGVRARYQQLLDAVAPSIYQDLYPTDAPWDSAVVQRNDDGVVEQVMEQAELALTKYPLHPKVQGFFDDHVGKYGHGSILELTGSPAVFCEGISWLTAWLLFDNPQCAGQEFSTRAVQHKDWPLARECYQADGTVAPDFDFLHKAWFDVFEAEVVWWKDHLTDPENRKALGIGDKEPFRPALDRARWALPGTIATGAGHTSPIRERSRVLEVGSLLAQASEAKAAQDVWSDLYDAYREALPGMAHLGLREALYKPESTLPGHIRTVLSDAPEGLDVELDSVYTGHLEGVQPFTRQSSHAYIDPSANALFRHEISFRCSLAVARDWHRHRPEFPWHLQVVRDAKGLIQIDHHYAPKSEIGKEKFSNLLLHSTEVFDHFMSKGNVVQAALSLPLGTRVRVRGSGGLRDVLYMLELRKSALGANFEYKEQATRGLELLLEQMKDRFYPGWEKTILETFGI